MASNVSLVLRYLGWLSATYPRAFDRRRPSPLPVGVDKQLMAHPDRPAWATEQIVGRALAAWTRRPKYRQALKHAERRAL